MHVCLTDNQPAIEGTIEELRNVAEYIKHSKFGSVKVYKLSLKTTAFPYNSLLEQLILDCGKSKIKGSIEDKALRIEYSETNAEVMASYFEFEIDSKYGAHWHFDQYGNEEYFDIDCLDMIVQVAAS